MSFLLLLWVNPSRTESAYEISSLRKIVIKYNLEENFGINIQMKVIDLEFLILSIWLDSPMLSPIFLLYNLKLKIQKFLLNLITNKILTFLSKIC
jgi:hypothetical protein